MLSFRRLILAVVAAALWSGVAAAQGETPPPEQPGPRPSPAPPAPAAAAVSGPQRRRRLPPLRPPLPPRRAWLPMGLPRRQRPRPARPLRRLRHRPRRTRPIRRFARRSRPFATRCGSSAPRSSPHRAASSPWSIVDEKKASAPSPHPLGYEVFWPWVLAPEGISAGGYLQSQYEVHQDSQDQLAQGGRAAQQEPLLHPTGAGQPGRRLAIRGDRPGARRQHHQRPAGRSAQGRGLAAVPAGPRPSRPFSWRRWASSTPPSATSSSSRRARAGSWSGRRPRWASGRANRTSGVRLAGRARLLPLDDRGRQRRAARREVGLRAAGPELGEGRHLSLRLRREPARGPASRRRRLVAARAGVPARARTRPRPASSGTT